MLAELTGLPSIGESTNNGVDYTSDFLGGLLFFWRLSLASLLLVSVSPNFLPCPFFFRLHDFYVDPSGVLQVSLLLHDCLASSQTGLDMQLV